MRSDTLLTTDIKGRSAAIELAAHDKASGMRCIAQERNLQPADIAKLMHERISTAHAMAFCEKHR